MPSGLGYALVPKLADYVLNAYNWQCLNAFFALLCFISSIFGILLKPLKCGENRKTLTSSQKHIPEISQIGWVADNIRSRNDYSNLSLEKTLCYNDQYNKSSYFLNSKIRFNSIKDKKNIPTFTKNGAKNCSKSTNDLDYSTIELPLNENYGGDQICFVKNASFCLTGISEELYSRKCYLDLPEKETEEHLNIYHITTQLRGNDDFYKPSTIKGDAKHANMRMGVDLIIRIMRKSSTINLNLQAIISNTFKMSVLKNHFFVGICFSNILVFMGLGIPFAFGPDMMVQKRIMSKENGSNLITPIGITSMIVMPLIGLLIDNGPKLNPILVTALSLMSAGLSMITILFCNTEVEAILISIWFGISFSAILSLPPVILERLIGDEDMKSAFSLLVLLRGISITMGGPLAGQIYDYTKEYDGTFYFAGGLFLVGSIPLFAIYLLRKNTYQCQYNL